MAITADIDETDRAGIALCAFQVTRQLGLVFREQGTSDFGVDAQAEMKRDGRPTGRLVGTQIKTGPSYFEEPYEDGWIFRPKEKHVQYWLNHSLPVYLLLADLDTMTVYWQEFTEQQLRTGPRGGLYVQVPCANVLATARGPWEAAAEKFASTAAEDYEDNLGRLAPSTASILRGLAGTRAGDAALLRAHLARGRHAPELTARTLLVSTPPWLAGLEADGYAALADFARSHGADALAAEVLLEGADRFPSRKPGLTANAGMLLLNSDRGQARELLDSAGAVSSGFNARVEIGLLILGHPVTSAAPLQIPAETARQLAAIDDDAVVLDFLARQHGQANDLDSAVRLAEKALAIEPDEWQFLDHLAHLLTRRSVSVGRRPDDQMRAAELAERAVGQLHRWDGPTGQALRTLLRALMLAGSPSKVLDRALPPPNGQASGPEAGRPEVISAAAAAALMLGRAELADTLVNSLPAGIDKQFAMVLRDAPSGDLESDRARWTALADLLDETRAEQLVQAVMRLADLGVDRSPRLDSLAEAGMIAPGVQALARAIAAAIADLPSGLPALRVLCPAMPEIMNIMVLIRSEAAISGRRRPVTYGEAESGRTESAVDIEANLAAFTGDLRPDARYASFDYCFNYFQSFREQHRTADLAAPQNLQMSCLQLGFYLASWGMLRGSATLLRKSARHYEPVIDVIAAAPASAWDLDAHCYGDGTWPVIRQLDQQIRHAFGHDNGVTSALATKVMLGVFGNIPAFDTRFRTGFRAAAFGPKAFRRIGEFYQEHADIIERHRIRTLDFGTGKPAQRRYSRAKVIDMIFFIEGGRLRTAPEP